MMGWVGSGNIFYGSGWVGFQKMDPRPTLECAYHSVVSECWFLSVTFVCVLLLRPDRGAEYCDERVCLSVCVCVCLSAIISSELHVRSSPNLFCLISMTVTRSSSGGVVIRYVLPVLRMTSYLHISQGYSTSPPS